MRCAGLARVLSYSTRNVILFACYAVGFGNRIRLDE